MKVIVTGASSFIGREAVKCLLDGGYEVWAAVRPGSAGLPLLEAVKRPKDALRILPVALDEIDSLKEIRELKEGCGFWLHLGWDGAGSKNRQDAKLQARNIGYALKALQTAADLGCTSFLFSGSQAEYGICSGPMREDQPCHPVSEYGKDKVRVCEEAQALASRLGIRYVHTRIFSVYGPGDHPWSLISTCIDTFLKGGHMKLGPCTQQWNFLHVSEAAGLLVQLLVGKMPEGVYNVAGEDTRPLRSYIEELYRLCGSRGSYEFGDRPPNAEGVVSLIPDLEKLKRETGFRQEISFGRGIAEMIERENK